MQDFIDQAKKNGVTLFDKGKCQFCGAEFQKGIFECMDNYNNGLELIDFNNSQNHIYKFLSVDAHALQHPEIHGRWSNHFHLTRLNLILEKNKNWDYNTSPILSSYLNEYKAGRPNEFLNPPKLLDRGAITTADFITVTTTEECVKLIKKWAEEVYVTWTENHLIVTQIADGFLNKKDNEHAHHRNQRPANPVYTRWLHCSLGNCLLTTKFVLSERLLAPISPPRLYRKRYRQPQQICRINQISLYSSYNKFT